MKSPRIRAMAVGLALLALAGSPAAGWNARGHRTITHLGLEGMSKDAPSWLRDPGIAARIADQANEPDRWRGVRGTAISAGPNLDHFIDVEDLEQFGLSLEEVPRPRYEYVRRMAAAKVEHPERILPYDASKDPDRSKEWPGFLPHAIDEHFAKLRSSFNTMRVLEAINDPRRAPQLEQARQNVIYEMGVLSHYVGDAAQPLHTTRHHHGWVGDNPEGYTTEFGFHSYIDGKIVEIHGLTEDSVRGRMEYDQRVAADGVWKDSLAYIRRSYECVEPLYKLQRDGSLTKEEGKRFIEDRFVDAGGFLAALYNAAWESSRPTDSDISSFKKFSEMEPAARPSPARVPAGK